MILEGDCIESMRTLEAGSVNCCVTSPPYYGLRDYGVDGQIGLEPTMADYIAKMVHVFREVRRVLRDDGTVWLNLGDSYASLSPGSGGECKLPGAGKAMTVARYTGFKRKGGGKGRGELLFNNLKNRESVEPCDLKPKNLMGIPWRVAFALQDDGWYLRQDIIWHKPNPMPESVTDRCTKAHEYIFLLSKKPQYYCDMEAIKEDSVDKESFTGRRKRNAGTMSAHDIQNYKMAGSIDSAGHLPHGKVYEKKNKRSVWTVTTKGFKDAHFATFPPDLIRPCILAGCPVDGVVLDPFGGSGTTAVVCMEEARNYIMCELNPEYVAMMRKRLWKQEDKTSLFSYG